MIMMKIINGNTLSNNYIRSSSEMLVNIYHTTRATFHKPIIFRGNFLVMCMHGGQTSGALLIPSTVSKVYPVLKRHHSFFTDASKFLSTNITSLKSTLKPQVSILKVLDVFFNQSMSIQIQDFQSANILKSQEWHRNAL
jgi:hypothetical protein